MYQNLLVLYSMSLYVLEAKNKVCSCRCCCVVCPLYNYNYHLKMVFVVTSPTVTTKVNRK